MYGSPACPLLHVAGDPFLHVYLLQSELFLQVVLGGGVLTGAVVELVNVRGGGVVVVIGSVVVGAAAVGLHP